VPSFGSLPARKNQSTVKRSMVTDHEAEIYKVLRIKRFADFAT